MGKRPTTLRITNAAEDVPRLIQGSGRTPAGGTWGFALAPHTREGVLLLAPKSGGVVRWDANPARGDAPFMPSKAVKDMSAATGKLRKLAKGPTAEVTPITLNGVWKAHMVCGEKGPVVTMTRPLNNYTTVVVSSAWDDESNKPVWAWTLKRDARWFAKKGSESGQFRTLRGAIGQALAAAEGVVGPACTIKETIRVAVDLERSTPSSQPSPRMWRANSGCGHSRAAKASSSTSLSHSTKSGQSSALSRLSIGFVFVADRATLRGFAPSSVQDDQPRAHASGRGSPVMQDAARSTVVVRCRRSIRLGSRAFEAHLGIGGTRCPPARGALGGDPEGVCSGSGLCCSGSGGTRVSRTLRADCA